MRRLIQLVLLGTLIPVSSSWGIYFSWDSQPGTVPADDEYYVSAHTYFHDAFYWWNGSITLYKNNSSVAYADASDYSNYCSIGYADRDTGGQTISYEAEVYEYSNGVTERFYQYVTIAESQPPNSHPSAWVEVDGLYSGVTLTRPHGGSIDITLRFKASDSDGNLTGIRPRAWLPDWYFNENESWTNQSGSSGEVVRTVTLNRNGTWYFWTEAQDGPLAAQGQYVAPGSWNWGYRITVVEEPLNSPPELAFDWTPSSVTNGQYFYGSGWAADFQDGAPVNRVEVYIDGSYHLTANLWHPRADVASAYERSDFYYSGFDFGFYLPHLSLGNHTATVRAFDNNGAYSEQSRTFTVTNTAPVPWISSDVTSLYSGTSTNIRVRVTDADANASWLNLDIISPIGGYFGVSNTVNALAPDNGGLYGIGPTSDYTRTLSVHFPRPGAYVFRTAAGDTSGGASYGEHLTITVPNRDPSISMQILDASRNAFPIDANGRAVVPTFTNFYIRISGSDPDGRLARLYARVATPAGGGNYPDAAVSGASAYHDFGPFNTEGTVGIWDVWGHVCDQDEQGYQWAGGGWMGLHSPDIEVYQPNRAPSTVTHNIPAQIPPGAAYGFQFGATDQDNNLQHILVHYRNESTGSGWRLLRAGDTIADYGWNGGLPGTAATGALASSGGTGSLSPSRAWAPDLGFGTYLFHIRAIDASGLTSFVSTTATMAPPVPTITSANSWTVPQLPAGWGSVAPFQITSSPAATSYSLSGTLPSGLSFNAADGKISGTPTQTGVFNLIVGATRDGATGTQAFNLTVVADGLVANATVSALYVRPGVPATFTALGSGVHGLVHVENSIILPGQAIQHIAGYEYQYAPNSPRPTNHTFPSFPFSAPAGSNGSCIYKIRLVDAAGNFVDREVTYYIDGQVPGTPAAPDVVSTSLSSISLSWTVPSDNYGVTAYALYRDGTLLSDTLTGTSFTVGSLAPGTTYVFKLRARDAAGNWSADSPIRSVSTVADTVPPTTPPSLQPGSRTNTTISFNWAASSDNVGVIGYRIYRNGQLVGTTDSTSFTDIGLASGTTYNYSVVAYDAASGESVAATLSISTTANFSMPPGFRLIVRGPDGAFHGLPTSGWQLSSVPNP